ncbi:MAG TPA: carboxypeptidase-like regulatory domain-containing protein, partial [Rubrobacteraceae bacterium]|nr:carboxypeptidase-like regulatory domain-containing protein [Rubrobacteraceae bacterium]
MVSVRRLEGSRSSRLRFLAALFLLLAVALLVSQAPELLKKAGAQTSASSLVVKDLKTGDPIPNFKYTVNADNVGDPADPPNMPSMIKGQSNSPVAAVGDASTAGSIDLDPGKYVASVDAEGYKLGGEHFTAGDTVTVYLEAWPKAGLDPSRLSKIQVHAFEDVQMLNGEDDAPLEAGLEAFDVVIHDEVGEVTQDYYGNPLGTEYQKDTNGDLVLDADGNPVPVPNTGGNILTDPNGDVTVENLPPGKYGVQVVPPDGEGWIQTSTLEGSNTIDAWIDEGSDGSITEAIGQPAGPMADIGFVQEKPFANPGSGEVKGRVMTAQEFVTETAEPPLGDPVANPYIGLTALDLNDELSYLGRGNPDGTFDITGVPDGKYQLVVWDEPMDYIISFRTVIVSGGQMVDMGDIAVPRWFAQIEGKVFEDNGVAANGTALPNGSAGNQIRDCANPADQTTCEKGLPNVDVGARFKDGTVKYNTLTGADGGYSLDEVFPFGRFMVSEVGNARFASTGSSVRSEYNATDVKSTSIPGALLMGTFSWSGVKNYIDWGKKRYTGSENGGISGIVYYATMRTEQNARYQSADDYEPGIPGVTVNLYKAETDANGDPLKNPDGSVQHGPLVNSVQTDSWQQPENCDVLDENGNPAPDLVGYRAKLGPDCLEVFALGAESKDGVFDGGYAFMTDSAGNPLQPGDYVVKVEIPKDKNGNDLYKIVKEEDVNTDQGENFVPQVPPAACAGALHTVNDPRSPYDGQDMPLCDDKLVQLNAQQNAAADFFMFTDTPIPGRVVGLVTDDLNIETDPNLLYYGDKKGLAHIPIGVRDHTGRLIQTVYTDDNGIFETILPSTGTYNVPTPSGVSPNMYSFITNDPGDIDNPNPIKGIGNPTGYDPNYGTLKLIYDVWPGKTTYADLAILPNTPGGDPGGVEAGEPQPGVPDVEDVENPVIQAAGARNLIINGQNFGTGSQV